MSAREVGSTLNGILLNGIESERKTASDILACKAGRGMWEQFILTTPGVRHEVHSHTTAGHEISGLVRPCKKLCPLSIPTDPRLISIREPGEPQRHGLQFDS